MNDVESHDETQTARLRVVDHAADVVVGVPAPVEILGPRGIEIPVVVAQIARLRPHDRGHVGPELLAVPRHLLDLRGRYRPAVPVRRVVGLVHEEVPDDRTVTDVGIELQVLEPIDPRLPLGDAEAAAGVLVVAAVAGQHEHDLPAPGLGARQFLEEVGWGDGKLGPVVAAAEGRDGLGKVAEGNSTAEVGVGGSGLAHLDDLSLVVTRHRGGSGGVGIDAAVGIEGVVLVTGGDNQDEGDGHERSKSSDPAGHFEALGHTRAFPLSVNIGLGGGTLFAAGEGPTHGTAKAAARRGMCPDAADSGRDLPVSYGGVCEVRGPLRLGI